MGRVTINKKVLDRLILAKVEGTSDCMGVRPLPVVRTPRDPSGCNWAVPGWTGENGHVTDCVEKIRAYLQFLRTQFDVPEDPNGNGSSLPGK